jgi:hypothetical protein
MACTPGWLKHGGDGAQKILMLVVHLESCVPSPADLMALPTRFELVNQRSHANLNPAVMMIFLRQVGTADNSTNNKADYAVGFTLESAQTIPRYRRRDGLPASFSL